MIASISSNNLPAKADQEIFRLKDEVEASEGADVNFYGIFPILLEGYSRIFSLGAVLDFLGVKARATQDEINKAFRKKSRLIHPDKAKQSFIASSFKSKAKSSPDPKGKKPGVHVNTGPSQREIRDAEKQASDRFARLGVVANILKGSGRERYDHFLNNGFPKWKGTGYYYARLRPGLGSVLVALFVLGGGAAHYAAMYLSWKRQRDFVGRYIRHARRAAWGDEIGIKGIPGADTPASGPPTPPQTDGAGRALALNRRQKRLQEKESKKEKEPRKVKGARANGTDNTGEVPATNLPHGERKKVIAENGKVLIVDSLGNVYLEEEGEEGDKAEYLLDVDEIPRPTFKQTVLVRLPVWLFDKSIGRLVYSSQATEVSQGKNGTESGTESNQVVEEVRTAINGIVRKRGKKSGRAP